MRIVAYDDEKKYLDDMKNSLDKLNLKHENIFGTPVYFGEKNKVMEYADENKGQSTLFLLDIMADGTPVGFELAKYIKDIEPSSLIVFVSYFDESLLFNVSQEIKSCTFISKASDRCFDELEEALLIARAQFAKEVYMVKDNKNIKPIKYDDIIYFKKMKGSKYIELVYKYGHVFTIDTLKNIKSELTGKGIFLYSTKEFIVNAKGVTNVNTRKKILTFTNGDQVPYSIFRKRELLRCISEQTVVL